MELIELTLAQYFNLSKISVFVIRIHPNFIIKNEYSISNFFNEEHGMGHLSRLRILLDELKEPNLKKVIHPIP